MYDDQGWAGAGYTVTSAPEGFLLDLLPDHAASRLDDAAVRRAILAKRHDDLRPYVWLLSVDAIRAAVEYAASRSSARIRARRHAHAALNSVASLLPSSLERVGWAWDGECNSEQVEQLIYTLANRLADEVLSRDWTCPRRFAAAVDEREALMLQVG